MRTYGDFVVDGMAWLESDEVSFILRGKLPSEAAPEIMRTLALKTIPTELADEEVASLWKSTIRKTGGGAGEFWQHYIAPHKGKWLTGTLLVTYLAMPEKFHDAVGNLTEYAARELGKLGISVPVSVGRGLINGIADGVARQYAANPVSTVVSLVVIGFLLLISIPGIRWLVWHRGLRRLFFYGSASNGETKRAVDRRQRLTTAHQPLKE